MNDHLIVLGLLAVCFHNADSQHCQCYSNEACGRGACNCPTDGDDNISVNETWSFVGRTYGDPIDPFDLLCVNDTAVYKTTILPQTIATLAVLPCGCSCEREGSVAVPIWLNLENDTEPDANRYKLVQYASSDWVLEVDNVQNEHEGSFRCITYLLFSVIHNVTQVYRSFSAYHWITLEAVVWPEILDQSDDIVLNVGDSVTVFCLATGEPTVHFSWKLSSPLGVNISVEGDYVIEEEILIDKEERLLGGKLNVLNHTFTEMSFSNAQWYDDGVYGCVASIGFQPDAIGYITIRVATPTIDLDLPYESKMGYIGEYLTLTCHVSGNYIAAAYWMKDGEILTNSNKYTNSQTYNFTSYFVTNVEITFIHRLSDLGNYTCYAISNTTLRPTTTVLSRTMRVIDSDECLMTPCSNGGQCSDRVGGFVCDCTGTAFYGPTCSLQDALPSDNIDGWVSRQTGYDSINDGLSPYIYMIIFIVMGLTDLIIVTVALFIFYKRRKKQEERFDNYVSQRKKFRKWKPAGGGQVNPNAANVNQDELGGEIESDMPDANQDMSDVNQDSIASGAFPPKAPEL